MMDALEAGIFHFIADSPVKITFPHLRRCFCGSKGYAPGELKRAIARLIASGSLCYRTERGHSFIDVSYDRPVTVSEHVILTPPRISCSSFSGQCVVTLQKGVSFGGGEHPSTRLAIQLIDKILDRSPWSAKKTELKAADIGTGCGVLAIVAAKRGLGHVIALDMDPCAVFEARANVTLNCVEGRVAVSSSPFDALTDIYDLVFANLRAPTLLELRQSVSRRAAGESAVVLSGIKADEAGNLCDAYAESGFFEVERRLEKGWCALCLMRGEF